MISYLGEMSFENIQDCAPLLKKMMENVNDEFDANDYRNGIPEIARNAQIVETSKNLLWFVTFNVRYQGMQSNTDFISLSQLAAETPSGKVLGTELYYGAEVMFEDKREPERQRQTRGFMCMKCAGIARKDSTLTDEILKYGKKAYEIYRQIKSLDPKAALIGKRSHTDLADKATEDLLKHFYKSI